jgi:tetratricopeptide (TPR) repeat protein
MLARLRERAGDYAEAEALFTAALESRTQVLGKDHDVTLNTAMNLGRVRLERHEYTAAETLLRETLASYENRYPARWQRYACESLLGAALAAQRKYDEAEPRLLSGYGGMNQRKETIPAFSQHFLEEAQESLVKLYRAEEKPDKVAEWARK